MHRGNSYEGFDKWQTIKSYHKIYDTGVFGKFVSVILVGMTASMLYNVCASVLRSIGDTVMPLCFLIFSTVLNIVLDYFFIKGLNYGVEGAAYATVISQFDAFILCVIYMLKKYDFLRFDIKDLKPEMTIVLKMLTSGLSMGFMQSLVSLGTVSLQSAINTFGTNTIVAHTVARKVTELFMLPFSVLGMTMTTYCGQNLGAGEVKRIKEGIKVDTLLYFVTAVISIFRNSLQGIGDCIIPVVSSGIEFVGKILVVIFLVPQVGYWGIIIAEPIVWVMMVIPLIIRMFTIKVLKVEEQVEYEQI